MTAFKTNSWNFVMTLFVFASVLSAFIFLLAFRGVNIFDFRDKYWPKLLFSALAAMIITISITLIYHYFRVYHLDPLLRKEFDRALWFIAFEGSGLRKIVFGMIFGVFFAYWVGFLFEGGRKHGLQEIVIGLLAGLVLVIFLFIGLGGEEAIEGVASRITGVTLQMHLLRTFQVA